MKTSRRGFFAALLAAPIAVKASPALSLEGYSAPVPLVGSSFEAIPFSVQMQSVGNMQAVIEREIMPALTDAIRRNSYGARTRLKEALL